MKLEILTKAINALTEAQQLDGLLERLMIAPESPLRGAHNVLTDALIAIVAEVVGDKEQWVEWYVYDNEMGRKALEVHYTDGTTKAIVTPKDLLEAIE